MPDREKVASGLRHCLHYNGSCLDCPYDGPQCQNDVLDEALALLEEQEAVEPNVSDINDHDAHGSWWYQCGKCKMPIDYGDRFCKRCGQKAKWCDSRPERG